MPALDSSTGELDDFEIEVDEHDEHIARCEFILEKILERKTLDLGLARFVTRKARRHEITSIIKPILDDIHFFEPVMNDVCLLLNEITDDFFVVLYEKELISLVQNKIAQLPLNRIWLEWYLVQHTKLTDIEEIRSFITSA
jgi:hypothetical protein